VIQSDHDESPNGFLGLTKGNYVIPLVVFKNRVDFVELFH